MSGIRRGGQESGPVAEGHDAAHLAEVDIDARLSELFSRSPRPPLDPRFTRRVLSSLETERRTALARRLTFALSVYWLVAAAAALSLLLALDWPGGGDVLTSQLWILGLGALAATPLLLLHWALQWAGRRGGLLVLFDSPLPSARR